MDEPHVATYLNKGFSLSFKNGWTVLVQFGPGNYCKHHAQMSNYDRLQQSESWESPNAECAAWHNPSGNWFKWAHDDVIGYCDPDWIASFIQHVANLPAHPITDRHYKDFSVIPKVEALSRNADEREDSFKTPVCKHGRII